MKKSLLIWLFLSTYWLYGQRAGKHSLSIGFQTGLAKLKIYDLSTGQFGIILGHQRCYADWFALRTELVGNYIAEAEKTEKLAFNPDIFGVMTERTSSFTNFQINLQLNPTTYYRDENFNLFLGLTGGIGVVLLKKEVVEHYYNYPNWGGTSEIPSSSTDSHLQIGYGPKAGVGFKIGGKRETGEIEIAISYQQWFTRFNLGWPQKDLGVFGVQTTYRHNFLR